MHASGCCLGPYQTFYIYIRPINRTHCAPIITIITPIKPLAYAGVNWYMKSDVIVITPSKPWAYAGVYWYVQETSLGNKICEACVVDPTQRSQQAGRNPWPAC